MIFIGYSYIPKYTCTTYMHSIAKWFAVCWILPVAIRYYSPFLPTVTQQSKYYMNLLEAILIRAYLDSLSAWGSRSPVPLAVHIPRMLGYELPSLFWMVGNDPHPLGPIWSYLDIQRCSTIMVSKINPTGKIPQRLRWWKWPWVTDRLHQPRQPQPRPW